MGTRSQTQSKMDGSHLAPGGIGGGAGVRHGEDVGGRPNLSRLNSHESQSHQDFFSMNIPSRPASVLGAGMDGNASKRQPRKLVLCFDGTGNKFKGDDSDSNILKIFRMLDRNSSDQYHYYQPGIGTYIVSHNLSRTGTAARLRSWYMKAKDSAVGSSFDQHVVGGYRFLMRFYCPGDEIFIFGFSRGAYTARFLAEMLDFVGLLSHGNEEMISFAWKAFSQWQCRRSNTSPEGVRKKREMYRFLKGFRETFSRPVRRIRFLGLFDTVNSVPRFETAWMERSKFPYTARTSAKVVRHAVSIDERRAKFRQDLMYQSEAKRHAAAEEQHRHQQPTAHDHHGHDGHGPGEKYRRRSSTATLKPLHRADQAQGRGRHATLAVPDADEMAPYRARSRSRSRATGVSGADCAGGNASCDAESSISQIRASDELLDGDDDSDDEGEQDIDEIWFAGGHGDVGGGWEILHDTKSASHVPLTWMVREAMKAGLAFDEDKVREMGCLEALGEPALGDGDNDDDEAQEATPAGRSSGANGPEAPDMMQVPDIMVRRPTGTDAGMFEDPRASAGVPSDAAPEDTDAAPPTEAPDQPAPNPLSFHEMMHKAHLARVHDSLMWDCGMSFGSVLSWRLMEYLPFRRMDLQPDGSWKPIRWPLPCGEVRDVPANVRVHGSVIRRMRQDERYRPGNLIIGGGGRGCRVAPKEYGMGEWVCIENEGDPIGEIWIRKGYEGERHSH